LTSLKSCRSPCTWHCHHATDSDTKSLSLQRCGRAIRQIWIRWTTASRVSFKRGFTVRRSMMWRVEWTSAEWVEAAGPHHHRGSDCALQWCSRLNACVRVNGGHFEHKFWASDFLLFCCLIDTGSRKCDRYKHCKVLISCEMCYFCVWDFHMVW